MTESALDERRFAPRATPPSGPSLPGSGRSGNDVDCDHCGLPVPPGLIDPHAELQFCCGGCRTVYEVLHTTGLDRFYELREDEADREPARTTGRGYEELDDEKFHELHTRELSEGIRMVELVLEGVHCAACVWLVEKLPEILGGVLECRLDLRRAMVRVLWDDRVVKLSRVARVLDSLGYPAHPAKGADARRLRAKEDRRFLVWLGVAGAAAGNVMALSFALYGGAFTGIEASYSGVFRIASTALGLLTIAWPGRIFFRGAWAALRTRTPHLDLPIALGISVGAIAGVVNTITGHGEIYFDSITVLIFLLLVGRFIQHRQQRWAADSLELLFSLTPSSARRVEEDGAVSVPIEALRIGDLVEVAAGDTVPVDGVVETGRSSVDRSLLTGESRPESLDRGDAVRAGSINLSARLLVRVEAVGEETRIGRLMQAVEEHARRKAPIVRAADRIAGWFVAAVIVLAAITLGVWWTVDPSLAISHATALLIVTCPCALGLATPLVISVAIGRAAKAGIFVKGGDALERLSRGGVLLLDKTGTVTEGRVGLVEYYGGEDAKPLVRALEAQSSHPIAQGLVDGLGGTEDLLEVEEAEQVIGAGIVGRVAGRDVAVGSPEFVGGRVGGHADWSDRIDALTGEALTPVLVAVDGEIVAAAGLGDPIRTDAAEAVRELRAAGLRVGMLSGDHSRVVDAVAARIGIDSDQAHGGVTPERKLEAVERHARDGSVVMVGDGVNDAAALAAASVGIAVHGGAEASVAAADIYLSRPGLGPVAELVDGGRRSMRVIRTALTISLVYNSVAAALAMSGAIHPWIAAILMPVSSLTVLTLALVSRTFRGR